MAITFVPELEKYRCSKHGDWLVLREMGYWQRGKLMVYTYWGCPVAGCEYKRADKTRKPMVLEEAHEVH